MQLSSEMLSGKTTDHLFAEGEFAGLLQAQVVEPFCRLRAAAKQAGFALAIASAYRSFDRQLTIWNAKATGKRPIRNESGAVLDIANLTELELTHAILRWSALPGASRHHWGTDMDVYDASRLPPDVGPQLLASEYAAGGPFAELDHWMQNNLSEFGFSRPYSRDTGGIAPEAWHISYQPIARHFEEQINPGCLNAALSDVELELGATVRGHLDEIFERYIQIT